MDNEDWGAEYSKLADLYAVKCKEVRELQAQNKQIRADVVEEHFTKIMSFINTSNRGNSDYFIVDQIENYIAEQLKEQENE